MPAKPFYKKIKLFPWNHKAKSRTLLALKKKKSLKTPEDTLPSSSPLYKRFLDPARRQQKGITDFQREINSQSVRSVASIWIFRLVFIVLSSRLS